MSRQFWRIGWISTLLMLISVSTGSRCTFPLVWEGSYFQLGYSSPLAVSNTSIQEKGACVWSSGSQYVLKSVDVGESCWRCLSIHRKHHNVIHYKESDCLYRSQFNSPEGLCQHIAGDGPMYSLIRVGAQPTKCPLKGPYMLTYAKGGTGVPCSFPRSYADSCRDHTTLNIHYQACTDVQGSESTSEEIACIASWREGSKGYFVGELMHEFTNAKERRYRCFVHEHIGKGHNRTVKMAESDSATCSGLWSTSEGYRVFEMQRVSGSGSRCVYPDWLSRHHSWRSLDATLALNIHTGGRSLKLVSANQGANLLHQAAPHLLHQGAHLSCQEMVEDEKETVKVVHYVKQDCDSGYICTLFSKVAENVISVQFGGMSRNPAEACTDLYYSDRQHASHLLVSRAASAQGCPLNGQYSLVVPGGTTSPAPLNSCRGDLASMDINAGCGSGHLQLMTQCEAGTNTTKTELGCQAYWTEGGVSRLILAEGTSDRFLCLSYTDLVAGLSVSSCNLEQPHLQLRQTGPCLQALTAVSSARPTHNNTILSVILVALLVKLF